MPHEHDVMQHDAVHVQHHAERLGAQLARIAVGVVAPTGDHARLVMIAEEQAGPTGLPHGWIFSQIAYISTILNWLNTIG